MKLTKREKLMLQILCGMLLLFGYYYLLVGPQWSRLQELRAEKHTFDLSVQGVETALESKDLIEKEITRSQEEINQLKGRFFPNIDQGRLILLLDEWLEYSSLYVPAISFSEYRVEKLAGVDLEAITVTVPFEGDYGALMELLKEIRDYEKRVLVGKLKIQNNSEGTISGSILLDFYSLKDNKDEGNPLVFNGVFTNKINPFSPFQGFVWQILNLEDNLEELEDNLTNIITEANTDFTEDFDDDLNEGSTVDSNIENPPPIKESKTILGLNDFESLNTFFVGEPREVVGGLNLEKDAQSGNHSLRLDYDFLRPRQRAAFNVVFEGESMILEVHPEKIQLSVYAFVESNHSISLILRDSKGKEHTVSLAQQVNWRGWRRLEGSLPKNIIYPAILQRIVIESKNFDPVTKGTLLLDQLEVVYPEGYLSIEASLDTDEYMTYQVQDGDTLFSIAKKFYNDPSKRVLIMEYNEMLDENHVEVGEILLIPKL